MLGLFDIEFASPKRLNSLLPLVEMTNRYKYNIIMMLKYQSSLESCPLTQRDLPLFDELLQLEDDELEVRLGHRMVTNRLFYIYREVYSSISDGLVTNVPFEFDQGYIRWHSSLSNEELLVHAKEGQNFVIEKELLRRGLNPPVDSPTWKILSTGECTSVTLMSLVYPSRLDIRDLDLEVVVKLILCPVILSVRGCIPFKRLTFEDLDALINLIINYHSVTSDNIRDLVTLNLGSGMAVF